MRDSDSDAAGIVEHFEKALGPITLGWALDSDGTKMPFQIVRFARGSDDNSVGFATIGLSRYALSSPVSGREIRQELFMLAPKSQAPDTVVSLLLQVGSAALGRGRPLLRGDVIGPAGSIAPGSELTALYVTMPVYFPDEFATFTGSEGSVVVAWLVPISTPEADFVALRGWDAFEADLAQKDPDLVDFYRESVTS
ncbi:suppressor of fused domain protein [Microbacterium sp. NPDC056052]|uniref:suppressor of fused domain protein n=1 Tax=Microbacterium sp. NPDC056052 TaxID=3345695 RepID=UPI0035DC42E6